MRRVVLVLVVLLFAACGGSDPEPGRQFGAFKACQGFGAGFERFSDVSVASRGSTYAVVGPAGGSVVTCRVRLKVDGDLLDYSLIDLA